MLIYFLSAVLKRRQAQISKSDGCEQTCTGSFWTLQNFPWIFSLPKPNSPCPWWSLCSACTQCLKETGSLLSPGTELLSHAPRTPKKILIFCMLLSTFIIKTQVWYLLGQCKTLKISRNIPNKRCLGRRAFPACSVLTVQVAKTSSSTSYFLF